MRADTSNSLYLTLPPNVPVCTPDDTNGTNSDTVVLLCHRFVAVYVVHGGVGQS
jgi:hypothetical protein